MLTFDSWKVCHTSAVLSSPQQTVWEIRAAHGIVKGGGEGSAQHGGCEESHVHGSSRIVLQAVLHGFPQAHSAAQASPQSELKEMEWLIDGMVDGMVD